MQKLENRWNCLNSFIWGCSKAIRGGTMRAKYKK